MKRLLVALLLVTTACATAPPAPQTVQVVLVGTTDVHGWFNGRIESGVQRGGVALLASHIQALRDAYGGNVVLLDSGDMFQGTLESNLFEGEPVVLAYNALGYAAAAVGNHEFDFGPVGEGVLADEPGDDPLGALKRAASIAEFPLLAANMVERATGAIPAWARASTMVEVDGATIGIIGLATPDTPNVTLEANVRSLDFRDPVAATLREARALRVRGADAIVVIAHMGGRCTSVEDPFDASSCDERHEANQLLEALPAGTVDVYFGGHTHQQMRHFINGTGAVQSLPYSTEFSAVEITIDPAAGRVLDERTILRPPTKIEGAAPDPRIQAVIAPFLEQVAAKRNQPLGLTATAAFERGRARETTIGNLLADAMREWAGTDFAFMNSGGIRADLRAGALIYADIFEVSPFDNYPAVVTMTGQQVIDALNVVSSTGRGLLQVSGLRYTVDAASGYRVTDVTVDGEPIDRQKLYRVVMPDFLAYGGDGMAPVTSTIPAERISIDQARPVRDIVLEALQKRGLPLTPALDGRITVRNEPAG
ncbi:MAG TPA: bifunctional UDP-sugar hydrolase/5'-nucleotidase [Thermoanaerobaculia bacterium]|nr:bifunctional UDP-sugar hydrolase/5'-nucleotidase [Thermoanaerobaculia bacterium]